ncbi:MAG: transcriptional regulator, partial [Lactobacillus iners]
DCDISALINHEPNSIFEIMHIIFDYEKDIKFRPSADTGEITGLLSNDIDFNNFLIEWNEMRKKHYNDEITDEEFEDWKLSYPKKSRFLK